MEAVHFVHSMSPDVHKIFAVMFYVELILKCAGIKQFGLKVNFNSYGEDVDNSLGMILALGYTALLKTSSKYILNAFTYNIMPDYK